MMSPAIPYTQDLVLVGGGHAHALLLRKWGMNPLAGVRLTLIDPMVATAYTGMLPGHVAGHYPREALDIDLVGLARHAGARFIRDRAVGLDPDGKQVRLAGRAAVRFDVVSLDVGITSRLPLDGAAGVRAVPAKPLGPFATAWETFVDAVKAGEQPPEAAVIGGGVAGCELAMAMHHRLAGLEGAKPRVALVEAGEVVASELPRPARRAIEKALGARGIAVITGTQVTGHGGSRLQLADGSSLPAAFIAGAVGAQPQAWLAETGLALEKGYVRVDEALRSVSHAGIFAVGDCAHLDHAPRPKAGVYAVREAPVLFDNLRTALTGEGKTKPYRPQSDYLKLISIGRRHAVANKGFVTLSGDWLWQLKDRIDRDFMDKLRELPDMQADLPETVAAGVGETLAPGAMPCAGCGAKMGRDNLLAALDNVPGRHRDDVLAGPGDDCAVLKIGGAQQVVTTDHMRAFTSDPCLMARVAAVHALGDIWAMGAQPQAALATLILPHANRAIQSDMLAEIMAGAGDVFTRAGAAIAGGHTSMGGEMTIGFTVTGLVAGAPIRLSGAQPGDRLVLTKPIGTGVILAGEMRRKAGARDVAAAWDSMARPLAAASQILTPHARAMTDVTGFGLAGHLMALLEASQVSADLDLAAVPLLAGARALSAAGIRSSLWPENAGIEGVVRPQGPKSDLLFDPQTSGGLLAAVPVTAIEEVCARLEAAGETAALIGEIGEGPPQLRVS